MDNTDWNKFFNQSGGGFKGYRYQRGGFALGSLFSGLFKSIAPVLKSAGKTVAKQALRTGLDVAGDLVRGEDIGKSLETRGRAAATTLLRKGKKATTKRKRKQKGKGGLGTFKRRRRLDVFG